ncbi:MAG: phosphoribosyltransferase [Gammaproteobacteria bacterium]|nr:phosphoribosyltransferase [Gammaproteobacteria bacterium]
MSTRITDLPELRDCVRVFQDRGHAGRLLSQMLAVYGHSDALVLAIPAGGIPVAVAIGKCLNLPVDVVVVSKITFPWNTEAGYGALAFDGTLRVNDALLARTGLSEQQIVKGVEQTRRKIERRVTRMRHGLAPLDVGERTLIVVDDGLASGFTMRVAVEALVQQGATSIVIAVPTGHAGAVTDLAASVQAVYCANVRTGWSFAVADAYEHWSDIDEDEAVRMLQDHRQA